MINLAFIKKDFTKENLILIIFIIIKLVISFFPVNYGIFRDEFYYLAMSENLDWGYLDVPPLAPFLLAIVRFFLGVSYFSLHLLPAITGCIILTISYLTVKKLNGGLIAQTLALSSITFAPQFIAFSTFYSYDYLDQLFWILVIFILLLVIKTEDKKYWLFFGIAAGIGLLTKITILYLGFAIFLALLLTKHRKYFLNWQFWTGGSIALLLFLPYIIWQISKDFIVLEYYKNYVTDKTAGINSLDFFVNHIITLNPLTLPLWILGIYYFLFNKEGKKYNIIGIMCFIVTLLSLITKTKYYLISPIFPVLFTGGAVLIENLVLNHKKSYKVWFAGSYIAAICLGGLFILPLARPVMSTDNYIKFSNFLKMDKQIKFENHALSALPQFYADRFGWEEMVDKINMAYNTLSDNEKKKCAIVVKNYGQAGAIEYYGKKYGLPKPVSGHLQYYIWGDRGYTGEICITLGFEFNDLNKSFDEITQVGKTFHKYAMPYENNLPIFVCKKSKIVLKDIMDILRHFD